jgi:hypothetical protein
VKIIIFSVGNVEGTFLTGDGRTSLGAWWAMATAHILHKYAVNGDLNSSQQLLITWRKQLGTRSHFLSFIIIFIFKKTSKPENRHYKSHHHL